MVSIPENLFLSLFLLQILNKSKSSWEIETTLVISSPQEYEAKNWKNIGKIRELKGGRLQKESACEEVISSSLRVLQSHEGPTSSHGPQSPEGVASATFCC